MGVLGANLPISPDAAATSSFFFSQPWTRHQDIWKPSTATDSLIVPSRMEMLFRHPARITILSKQVVPIKGAHRSPASFWNHNFFLLKPSTGSLKEPVKKRSSLFKVFWKGARPLFFLLKCLALSSHPRTTHLYIGRPQSCDIHFRISFHQLPQGFSIRFIPKRGSEMTWRKPFTIAVTGASKRAQSSQMLKCLVSPEVNSQDSLFSLSQQWSHGSATRHC